MRKKTKIICFFSVALFFAFFLSVADTFGSGQNAPLIVAVAESDEEIIDNLEDAADAIEEAEGTKENKAQKYIDTLLKKTSSVSDFGWKTIRTMLMADSATELADYSGVINGIVAILGSMAGSLGILFWLVTVLQNLIKYREITAKAIKRICIELFSVVIMIVLSVRICTLIYLVNAELVDRLLSGTDAAITINFADGVKYPEGSNLIVIQIFADFTATITSLLPRILASILMSVIAVGAIFKIMSRKIRCIGMMAISPVFFSCIANAKTRVYLKNFIASYINVVCETLFISIVYVAGMSWFLNEMGGASGALSFDGFKTLFVIFAVGLMIVNPPKVLSALTEKK